MCSVAGGAAILTTGVSIAGQVIGHNQQKKQAYDQWLYNVQKEAQDERRRGELIKYHNDMYEQDIDYGFTHLDYQKGEFSRQLKHVEQSQKAVESSRTAQYGQLLLRQVQESIATTLGIDDVNRQSRKMQAGAEATAASRGVEGVTIDQIIGDVARQAGESTTILEMNQSATMHQLNMEMQGVKATADQRIFDIPMGTFSPAPGIKPPAPVGQVSPAAPVPMPSNSALAVGIGTSVVQGATNYSKWSGTPMNQLFRI